MKQFKKAIFCLTVVLFFTYCSDNQEEDPVFDDVTINGTFSYEGGELLAEDPTGNIVKIEFPVGALRDTANVTLTLFGEKTSLPIAQRHMPEFEITPHDLNLYKPLLVTVQLKSAENDNARNMLFHVYTDEKVLPLSNMTYHPDNTTFSGETMFAGLFAEGKMSIEQINEQLEKLIASLGINWKSIAYPNANPHELNCDARIHKAKWDDLKETAGYFISLFKQRELIGYYNDLDNNQNTFQEDLQSICTLIINPGVLDILDDCIPEENCDENYIFTIADMVYNMNLLGCDEGQAFTDLNELFNDALVNCSTRLAIISEMNIGDAEFMTNSQGFVLLEMNMNPDHTFSVTGNGMLTVTGSLASTGDCSGFVTGFTEVNVTGTRNKQNIFELKVVTNQHAMLITVCPEYTVETPMEGEGEIDIELSPANGYTYVMEMELEDGTFVTDISLINPYTDLPYE